MALSRRPTVNFELNDRLETLGALLSLAVPRRVKLPYADKVLKHFAPFGEHPAVGELRRLLENGCSEPLLAEVALLRPAAGGLETRELAAFFKLVDEFSKKSGAAAFFKARKREHAAFIALARAEAARSQSAADVAKYLRMPFSRKYRLILAPLLPPAFAVNISRGGEELRVRCGTFGREGLTFEYAEFDCCVGHELTHTALTPLLERSRAQLEAVPGKPPKTCKDDSSWTGCFEEHLVRGITLRALKLSGDERSYASILKRWSRSGYPFLEAVCAELETFERSPKTADFASFYPGRLLTPFC